jgi:hypothetical protein
VPQPPQPRIAILGAGPIGLEAALYAATLGLPFRVYERGGVAEHLRQWGHVRLFSPFGLNTTPLGRARLLADQPQKKLPTATDLLTGRDHISAYLGPLSESSLLIENMHTDSRVIAVGRPGFGKAENPSDARRGQQPFRLLLRDGKGQERSEEADVVLDCTGTYGQHRFLGPGGLPALGELSAQPQIAYGLEDILGQRRGQYADRTTLVIGAGYSAATTVSHLAAVAEKHSSTWVIWLARRSSSQPIRRIVNDPLRERDQVAVRANQLATRTDGNVEFRPHTQVEAVVSNGPDKGFRIQTRCGGKAQTFEVERVIANIGYAPDLELFRELQVQYCPATEAIPAQGKPAGEAFIQPAALRQPEPNFFVLGSKSFGRGSQFLLRTGFDQVRAVFTLITGKPNLDLYQKG